MTRQVAAYAHKSDVQAEPADTAPGPCWQASSYSAGANRQAAQGGQQLQLVQTIAVLTWGCENCRILATERSGRSAGAYRSLQMAMSGLLRARVRFLSLPFLAAGALTSSFSLPASSGSAASLLPAAVLALHVPSLRNPCLLLPLPYLAAGALMSSFSLPASSGSAASLPPAAAVLALCRRHLWHNGSALLLPIIAEELM